MIADVLVFLRDRLNARLRAADGGTETAAPPVVAFLDGDGKVDATDFKLNAVSALLIHVEQEAALRAADPFRRAGADGALQRVHPDVCLNLYILFVARFKDYKVSWQQLSSIVEFFQGSPVFEGDAEPQLQGRVSQLVVELLTLPLAEQNDLWGALRSALQPSLLYRVKTLILRDKTPADAPRVKKLETRIQLGEKTETHVSSGPLGP